jgi:hypothetical protein
MGKITKINMPARLVELREQVLSRTTKRMPKWKFRLAPDIVLMLQPKVVVDIRPWISSEKAYRKLSLRFAGSVVMCGNASAAALASQKGLDDYMRIDFRIVLDEAGEWHLHDNGRSGRLGPDWKAQSPFGYGVDRDPRLQEYDRREARVLAALVEAFNDGRFDVVDSKVMLSAQCLICGKALTDPASMARYIGPECAGTSSVHVPRMRTLTKVDEGSGTDAAPIYEKASVPRRPHKPPALLTEAEPEVIGAEPLTVICSMDDVKLVPTPTRIRCNGEERIEDGLRADLFQGKRPATVILSNAYGYPFVEVCSLIDVEVSPGGRAPGMIRLSLIRPGKRKAIYFERGLSRRRGPGRMGHVRHRSGWLATSQRDGLAQPELPGAVD